MEIHSNDPKLMKAHEAGWNDWVDWLMESDSDSESGSVFDPDRFKGNLSGRYLDGDFDNSPKGIPQALLRPAVREKLDKMMDAVYVASHPTDPSYIPGSNLRKAPGTKNGYRMNIVGSLRLNFEWINGRAE